MSSSAPRQAPQCHVFPHCNALQAPQCIAMWENSTPLNRTKLYTMLHCNLGKLNWLNCIQCRTYTCKVVHNAGENSMYCNVGKLKWPLTFNCTCTHGPSTYTYKVLHIAMESSMYCNVGKLKWLPS